MRKAVVILAVCAVPIIAAGAQTSEWADKLFAKGGTSHNFGNIPRGAVLSHRFPLTNIYAVPLTITDIRVSCGCVTATAATKVLQPKETSYIEVVMDARRFTGPKNVNIFVTVGPQYVSTATLQVSANSRADVVFNPGEVNFGIVASGQAATQTIDVEYAGVLNWQITGLAKHDLPLDVQIKELYREVGRRVGYRLHITLQPTAPPGPFKYELLLQTNDSQSLLVPVLIEGNVRAALTAAPAQVKFDTTPVGQEVATKVLVISNDPGKSFRIVAVEGLDNDLTVDLPPKPDKSQIATLKWRPARVGELKRELRFRTDLDGGASVNVVVEGTASQP